MKDTVPIVMRCVNMRIRLLPAATAHCSGTPDPVLRTGIVKDVDVLIRCQTHLVNASHTYVDQHIARRRSVQDM